MWRRLLAFALLLCASSTGLFARGGGGCVAAGTLIDTPAGPRAIETLRAGDTVWSLVQGERAVATVQLVYAVEPAGFIELHAGGHVLSLTPEHPVQIAPGIFRRADELAATDPVFSPRAALALDAIRRTPADRPAYNLLVSPGGVFFANGLLVHNKGCFLPDTPITLADGSRRPISTVRVGDRVQAFSPDGLPAIATVRAVLTHEVDSYLVIRTATTELHVTEEHPFYVGGGTFQSIESLHVGDAINSFDGRNAFVPQPLLAVERRHEHVTVYNLQVDAPHTYFASGIAVHNKGGGCFAAGTLIATPDGPRPIETLRLGEHVLAPEPGGRLAPAEITGVYLNFSPVLVLQTDRGTLRTTEEHPLLAASGNFQPAAEFATSAHLARADGSTARIDAITFQSRPEPVYTLQVAGPHTFVADGFIVHNKGGGGGGGFRSGGSYSGGGGNSDPLSSAIVVLIVIGIFVYKFYSDVTTKVADYDNLDYCFSRSEITPKADKTRKLLEFIARTDASVEPAALSARAEEIFRKVQECWQARDYTPMQPLLMPDLFHQHCDQLIGLRQNHEINNLENLRVDAVDLVHLNYTDIRNGRSFTALITAWLQDYYTDDRDATFLRGDTAPARFQEFWTFQYWEGDWRLREIEQSRESGYLRSENFFESFTEPGRDQVYGKAAGKSGPLGPQLPAEVQGKDANIDRLLNFLVTTDPIWDREAMLAVARRCFTGVLIAWQDGRPNAFAGLALTPQLHVRFRDVNAANALNGWKVEYRNLCVRKVELIHVNNRDERSQDEFTARISVHAQVIIRQTGQILRQDEYVQPWVEFWTFRRDGAYWLLGEILPSEKGADLVALENTDEGSSAEMLQWYYSKERAT